jgi:hypothetical protein
MKTTISPEILNDTKLAAAVGQANEVLRSDLGPSEPIVTATWRRSPNGPIELEVDDSMASASAQFAPEELTANGYRVERKLNRLWGDVLQARSEKLLARIREWESGPEEE